MTLGTICLMHLASECGPWHSLSIQNKTDNYEHRMVLMPYHDNTTLLPLPPLDVRSGNPLGSPCGVEVEQEREKITYVALSYS